MSHELTESKDLKLTKIPVAATGMLIRRPAVEVFEAIVNPEVTTKFWFTKGSGRLEVGKEVEWKWEMYDMSIKVTAQVIEPNKRILMEWPGYSGPTMVEWKLQVLEDDATFLTVEESGFKGTGDELVKFVANSTQGFTIVLAGMKAFIEHGVQLNLVADRFPKGIDKD